MKYLHSKFILLALAGLIVVSCTSQPATPNTLSNTAEIINTLKPSSTLSDTPTSTLTQPPVLLPTTLLVTPSTIDESIQSGLVSPNGKFVVFITSKNLYAYDLELLEVIYFIDTKADIGSVAISPNSQVLVIGTQEKMLVYSLNEGTLITTIDKSVTNLAFSPDGEKIAIGMGDWKRCNGGYSLEIWQVSNWSLLQTLPLTNELDCISGLVFSPSGKFLAASAFEILVWEIGEKSSILKFRSWGCDIFEGSLAFTANDKTLVAGTMADNGRNNICLLSLFNGETLGVVDKANNSDYSCRSEVAASPDGQFMASNLDGKVTIWQTEVWKQIHSVDIEGNCSQLTGWFPDGNTMTFLLPDGSLKFLNAQTGQITNSVNLRKP